MRNVFIIVIGGLAMIFIGILITWIIPMVHRYEQYVHMKQWIFNVYEDEYTINTMAHVVDDMMSSVYPSIYPTPESAVHAVPTAKVRAMLGGQKFFSVRHVWYKFYLQDVNHIQNGLAQASAWTPSHTMNAIQRQFLTMIHERVSWYPLQAEQKKLHEALALMRQHIVWGR